ncbi:unnamed protein product, partial [Brassica rapa]
RHHFSKRHNQRRGKTLGQRPLSKTEQRHCGGRDRPQASPEPPRTRQICNRNRRI